MPIRILFRAAVILLLAAATPVLDGQEPAVSPLALVRTPAEPVELRLKGKDWTAACAIQPVTPRQAVTLLLLADTLTRESFAAAKPDLTAFYTALPRNVEMTLTILGGSDIRTAGPFKTRARFTEALTEAESLMTDGGAPPEPSRLYRAMEGAFKQLGGEWRHTVLFGPLPDLPPGTGSYAGALLRTSAATARVRLSLWSTAKPEWIAAITLPLSGTAASDRESLSAWLAAAAKENEGAFSELSCGAASVPLMGFRFENASIEPIQLSVPLITAAKGDTEPSIDDYLRYTAARNEALSAGQSQDAERRRQVQARVEEALAIHPGDEEMLRLGADLAMAGQDFRRTVTLLTSLGRLQPSNGALFDELGNAFHTLRDFVPAEEALRKARELQFTSPRNSEQLAAIRLAAGDDRGALPFLSEAVKFKPREQRLWLQRADSAEKLRDFALMAESLEPALKLGGLHPERRARLARHYLDSNEAARALPHLDAVAAELPAGADLRQQFAAFYDEMKRPEQALPLWEKTIEADPSREPAHIRIATIHGEARRWQAMLESSERGLKAAARSAPLHLARFESLAGLGRSLDARWSLIDSSTLAPSPAVLERAATHEDGLSARAATLYRAWAESLPAGDSKRTDVLRRGLAVAIRDQQAETAQWMADQLRKSGADADAERLLPSGGGSGLDRSYVLPGGAAALAIAARMQGAPPSGFMLAYSRFVASWEDTADEKSIKLFQKTIEDHFRSLGGLNALAQKPVPAGQAGKSTVALRASDKNDRKRLDQALSLLGWRLRGGKKPLLEPAESGDRANRQTTATALQVDLVAMKESLEGGGNFSLEIPWEAIPVFPPEAEWKAALYPKESPAGGLAEVLMREQRNSQTYAGLNQMSRSAAQQLLTALPLKTLVQRHSRTLAAFSSSFAVAQGAAVVPGGAAAQSLWRDLSGADPARPGPFFRALLEKDEGRLAGYFNLLSGMDEIHQRFYTRNAARLRRFYDVLADSPEMEGKTGSLVQGTPFADFLRELPLADDLSVRFPGSAEVWMVAKGQREASSLTRRLAKAVAPDTEDEIMIRLAKTRYKDGAAKRSELDNFIGVVRLDRFRATPLDEDTALLLAQNYAEYEHFYPHFTSLNALDATHFKSFFAFGAKVRQMDAVDANQLLASFDSLVWLLARFQATGVLGAADASRLFGELCQRLSQGIAPEAAVAASLDAVRQILRLAGREDSPSSSLRDRLIGEIAPATIRTEDGPVPVDSTKRRRAAFDQVLDLQQITPLEPLLAIDKAARAIAAAEGSAAAHTAAIEASLPLLRTVAVPKKSGATGKRKDNMTAWHPDRTAKALADIKQRLARKKVSAKDLSESSAELLATLLPQVGVALSGLVYATFLHPEDLLVSEDPLLVRKHEFSSLAQQIKGSSAFERANLVVQSDGAGSYFSGCLASFSNAAGRAAAATSQVKSLDSIAASELGGSRATPWHLITDADVELLGVEIRLGREWVVSAATDMASEAALRQHTLGRISLARQTQLLGAIEARDWPAAWALLTFNDLRQLGELVLTGKASPALPAPIQAAAARVRTHLPQARIQWLGNIAPDVCECENSTFSVTAPYEEFSKILLLGPISQRAAELRLHLVHLAGEAGLPSGALAAIADSFAGHALAKAAMADNRDWAGLHSHYAKLSVLDLMESLRTALGKP